MRPLLDNELLSVRLYAARQAESPEVLRSSRLPRVVLWWALARLGFTGEPGPRWLVRRRMVQRRRKLSRDECLGSFQKVSHPLACLTHACRLVELHGQDAIPALLSALPSLARSEMHAEAVAWALGTLGRSILAETLEVARKASPSVRHWLLLALWFLGPEAHGAEKDLLGWAEPMAEAVLLNLESRAAARAAREGRVEVVFLDDEAVAELAGQIFGEADLPRRRRAVRALRGFGPAQEAAVKLLCACLDDPELGQVAAQTLVEFHPDEALRPLLRDESFLPFIARLPAVREKLGALLGDETEPKRALAARVAFELALSLDELVGPQGVSALLLETQSTMRWEMLQNMDICSLRLPDLVLCAGDEHPGVRLVAAAVLRDRPEGRELLKQLAEDPDVDVALEATIGLLQQCPEDDRLTAHLLRDDWMRNRALGRLREPTPAVTRMLEPGEFRHPLPGTTALSTHQILEALRAGNLSLLARSSAPEKVLRLAHEHPDLLDPSTLADLIAGLGPCLSKPELLRAFLTHPAPQVTGAALAHLRRTRLSQEELALLVDHPVTAVRTLYAGYCADNFQWLLHRLAGDPEPEVRERVARTADRELVESMLEDPDRSVRESAAMRLATLGVLPEGLVERVRTGQENRPELLHLVHLLVPSPERETVFEQAFRAGQRAAAAPFLGLRLELMLEEFEPDCLERAMAGALRQGHSLDASREAFLAHPRRAEILQSVGRVLAGITPLQASKHKELLLILRSEPSTAAEGVRGLGKLLLWESDEHVVDRLLEGLDQLPELTLRALAAAYLTPAQTDRLQELLPGLDPGLQPLAWNLVWIRLPEGGGWQALSSILHPQVDVRDAEFLLHRLLEHTEEERRAGLSLDQPEQRWRLARLLLARGMVSDENLLAYLERSGDLTPTKSWAPALERALQSAHADIVQRARELLERLA